MWKIHWWVAQEKTNKQNKKRIGIEASQRIACANYESVAECAKWFLSHFICAKRQFHLVESNTYSVFAVLNNWRKIIVQTHDLFQRIECKKRLSKTK